jgi:hypothetical protein
MKNAISSADYKEQNLIKLGLIVSAMLFLTLFSLNSVVIYRESVASFFPPFDQLIQWQLFFDLTIALSFFLVWLFWEIKKQHKSLRIFYLFLVLTIAFGSLAPLLYFIFHFFQKLKRS